MQLSAVTVEVDVESDHAVIGVEYRFEHQLDSVRFVLMRFDAQSIRMLSTEWTLRERAGLFELLVRGAASPMRLRYRVDGAVRRLPVFVPDVPAVGRGRVEIRVAGANGASLADGFPRFERDSLGLVARLDNVPSAIRLPRSGGWSTNRLADTLVIVLLVLGTIVWTMRNRPRSTSRGTPRS